MKIRRIFATILCLALVLSMSVVAFAAVTHTLLNTTRNGYKVVGTASTTTKTASAKLNATATSTNPNRPAEDCTSTASVTARNSSGDIVAKNSGGGTISASTSASAEDGKTIARVEVSYSFCGTSYGSYTITP